MKQILSILTQFESTYDNLCFFSIEQLFFEIQKYLKENNIVAFRWRQGYFRQGCGDPVSFTIKDFQVLIDPSVDLEEVNKSFVYCFSVGVTEEACIRFNVSELQE
jgi:hypothetical protein